MKINRTAKIALLSTALVLVGLIPAILIARIEPAVKIQFIGRQIASDGSQMARFRMVNCSSAPYYFIGYKEVLVRDRVHPVFEAQTFESGTWRTEQKWAPGRGAIEIELEPNSSIEFEVPNPPEPLKVGIYFRTDAERYVSPAPPSQLEMWIYEIKYWFNPKKYGPTWSDSTG